MHCHIVQIVRYCPDPPSPDANGGLSNWNTGLSSGLTPYATTVEYSCDVARKLKAPDSSLYDTQTFTCEWDHTWSPTDPVSKAFLIVIGQFKVPADVGNISAIHL